MATKKKTKITAKKKIKNAIAKKRVAGKKIVIGKQVLARKKAVKAIAKKKVKSIQRKKTVIKTKIKKPVTPFLHNGTDLHLIPVTGEIHPARLEETHQFEKTYKHNEETALHFEQQRAKQIMAMTRGGGGKRIFKNRGQR